MSSDLIKIREIQFESELIQEGSWGVRDLGKHPSTMVFYMTTPDSGLIEWDIPNLEMTEHIGLTFACLPSDEGTLPGLKLDEYDGVFSLPKQAIQLLRDSGIFVDKEFE